MSLLFRTRIAASLTLLVALIAAPAAQSAKRPLTHDDYDGWRSIYTPTLTRDGRFLAYSFMPQEGDGELIVRDLKTGQERREPVGALPPPPIPTGDEVSEEPPTPRSVRIAMTSDSRFLVATTFAPKAATDQARRERKRPDEMPKGDVLVVNLTSGQSTRLPAAKSIQVPARGGSWLAYLKEAAAAAPGGGAGREANAREGAARDAAPRVEYGTDLVLRDLAQGTERVIANVLEYAFARDGKTLVYTVSSRTADENGVYAVTPGSTAAPAVVTSGRGKYSRLTWNRDETEVVFISDRDDAASASPRFAVYRWRRGASPAAAIVTSQTPGIPAGLVVSDRGQIAFSRDGSRVYVSVAPPARPARQADGSEDRVVVDLWHWQDDVIQPMQRVRANQDRTRSYRGVYHLAQGKYVQLADPTLRNVTLSDDGSRAFGMDDSPYRRMVDYDGNYSDVYLIDSNTGMRTLLLKQLRGGGGGPGGGGPLQWSPDGRYAFYYQDKHFHVLDVNTRATRNVTSALGVAVHDEDDDTPDPPGNYGGGGWLSDSKSFLVYDRYDVWQIFVDGQPSRNLTEGEGRRTKTEFRLQRLEADDDADAQRGLDPAKPLYLRGTSQETRATGFFKDAFSGSAPPQRLLWGDRNYRVATRAADADVVLVSASRFDEYPDLHVTDSAFRNLSKVSNGGAQTEKFLWGTSELVSFRNTDGVPLKAALFKPANFDPKKKYPMLVYIYEGLSQNVHNFVDPRPSHNINFAYYISNGYVILTPDIVYTEGQPGQSALKCVLPAIDAVVEKGFVDEARIGIQGHSWGGYQIAYMVTQTNRFRAVEAGAPVGNMTSAYSGIRWGSGLPRQFQYEQTQSRIGRPLYAAPHKYLENSPIFHIERVKTPMLILHNDNDDAVPWYQGIELYLALRRTGKEAYLFNYNGEFHGLRRRHNQKDFAVRMQQFFDHFLKGAAKPEWMEKGIPYLERDEEKDRIKKPTTTTSPQ
jgi:dipeptidyl aminopeptidase/acylaminoacyl peptidase